MIDRKHTIRSPILILCTFLSCLVSVPAAFPDTEKEQRYNIPLIDLDDRKELQTIVDRETGQYLGHPSTVLLPDGRTVLCVYPKGHGNGAVVMKRSTDGGRTWSDRLPTPDNWATSREVPTIYRTIHPDSGEARLIMFSGLYPIRMAYSENRGRDWTSLKPIGDFGGVVVMSDVVQLKDGRYMALFHDDGRFIDGGENSYRGSPAGERDGTWTVYKTLSKDGGLTWSEPEPILKSTADRAHLCEPGAIRSPDGERIAVLLRENSRRHNSYITFSDDEGETWTEPRELPAVLTGDRHQAAYAPDGRLFISFRDHTPRGYDSPTEGDWVGWVGTWNDLVEGRKGQFRVRLKSNHRGHDCAYPAIEVLPDGTFLATTYGHWKKGEKPYILSLRFTLSQLENLK